MITKQAVVLLFNTLSVAKQEIEVRRSNNYQNIVIIDSIGKVMVEFNFNNDHDSCTITIERNQLLLNKGLITYIVDTLKELGITIKQQ